MIHRLTATKALEGTGNSLSHLSTIPKRQEENKHAIGYYRSR